MRRPVDDGHDAPSERVGRFSSRAEAHVARAMLDDHGIEAAVVADDAAGLHPELSLATGGITLLVARRDADEARELLDDVEADGGDEPLHRSRMLRVWALLLAAILVALVGISAIRDAGLL